MDELAWDDNARVVIGRGDEEEDELLSETRRRRLRLLESFDGFFLLVMMHLQEGAMSSRAALQHRTVAVKSVISPARVGIFWVWDQWRQRPWEEAPNTAYMAMASAALET